MNTATTAIKQGAIAKDQGARTLRERISQPGMVGAIGAVAGASVQTAASAWRSGRKMPSEVMRKRLAACVALAESWLLTKRLRERARVESAAAVNEALRVRLRNLTPMHGACRGAPITLRRIAAMTGGVVQHQRLINFRNGDFNVSGVQMAAIERVVEQLEKEQAAGGGMRNEEGRMTNGIEPAETFCVKSSEMELSKEARL